jgi:adenine-specific DNA-methyltransferase
MPKHDGPKIVYGEASAIDAAALKTLGIQFRKIPHELAGTV